MIDRLMLYLIAVSGFGCALNGGVFFAFSNFVMSGLARLPASEGVSAMNSINVTVINPLFMFSLFGTAALCLAASVLAFRGNDPRTAWIVAAGVLYTGGVVVVTMVCNVPRNDALAAIGPGDAGTRAAWSEYLRSWTAWNHVRACTALLAAACLIVALCYAPSGRRLVPD